MNDKNFEEIKYDPMHNGPLVMVRMVYTDYRGLLLTKPYVGVSIDGSPTVDLNTLIDAGNRVKAKMNAE